MLDFINLSLFKNLAVCIVIICIGPLKSTAQSNTGTIAGTVVDAKSGEAVIGANVSITGTTKGAATDLDGNYTIRDLEPGIYSISVSYISYAKKTITGVEVSSGENTSLNISLKSKTVNMEEVTVTAQANQSSEAGLLSIQRKSVPVQDGLSSEQISKIGDGDVGRAMKRVTGVTVRNGKDVYVRGLGNRYSNIQLNGAQVPSTDPNKKEAPTDLFSSGLVESIMVQKTYTADQMAEFSGGSVKIVTKQFPYDRNFSISYSTSYNTVSTFEDTFTSSGSTTDFLGYDDGKRSMPSTLNNQRADQSNANSIMQDLHNDWNISNNKRSMPSQSYSINYANQFNQDKMPIGIVSNFSYKFNRSLEPGKTEKFVQDFRDDGTPNFNSNFGKSEGLETADLSGMLNIYIKPSSVTKFGLKTLYSNSATDRKTIVEGDALNFTTRQTVSDFDRRTVFSATLEGETYFENFLQSTLEGHIGYNKAQRVRPDRRSTQYNEVGSGDFQFSPFGDNNGHFFSNQDDNNYSGELKYKFNPLKFLDVTAGGNVIIKERRFTSRRLAYRDVLSPYVPDDLARQSPGILFDDANVLEYMELTETTQFDADWYDGTQNLYAAFISTKWQVLDNLSFEVGLRAEQSTQRIETPDGINGEYEEVSKVDSTNILPAINLTYEIADRTNFRLAYSQTLARPEFREISNFAFADYLVGQRVYGNPKLTQTNITNYDIRFEKYSQGGQMFAVSLFYKQFEKPIEKFYRLTEANEVRFDNAKEADLFGVEVEGRKNITDRLQVVANATYIYSETRMSETEQNRVANSERPMVGQSPYVINASVFYSMPDWSTDFSVSYNTFGERIVTVGKSAQRHDEYEQSFHDLGVKIDHSIGRFDLSLEASNLLDDSREYTLGDVTTFKYKPGMTFKLGATLSL
ncbi:TonB-dependent receptor domain-containing protein [Fodinibius sp. AD559]|uniref:TonB-dependent receptor domain-containing protein n=1 Tax=Fodinibius sp. AD559 TaxID=3424179 RepID=UPI0040469503